MIAVPFIYFSVMFLINYLRNQRKVDIVSYIYAIFGISGFFSILIDERKLTGYDTDNYQISFISAFLYCFIITVLTLPLKKIFSNKTKFVPFTNLRFVKIFSTITFIYFIINTLMSLNLIIMTFTGNLNERRLDLFNGLEVEGWYSGYPIFIAFPLKFLSLLYSCPWILQLMAFHLIATTKIPIKYPLMLFISSFYVIVSSIILVERKKYTIL